MTGRKGSTLPASSPDTMRIQRSAATLSAIAALIVIASCASRPSRKDLAKEYAGLGDSYFEAKAYDKAETAYRRAQELDPELVVNTYQLARSYAENGQFDKSLPLLEALAKKDAENAVVLNLYAYVLLKKGENEKALAVYEKVLALSPYVKDALFNAAIISYGKGDYGKAAELLEAVYSQDPADEAVNRLLAETCFAGGKRERGFEVLEAYSAVKDKDPEAFRIIARERAKSREYALALKAYRSYLELAVNDAAAWFDRARLELLAAKDEGAAKTSLEKAVKAGYADKERIRLLIDLVSAAKLGDFLAILPDHLKPEPGSEGESAENALGSSGAPLESPKDSPAP